MKKIKLSARLLRIFTVAVAIGSIFVFVPWLAACAYLAPLPDTVQAQIAAAVNYDLDGIIVYVDKKGQEPEFYSAGWKNREDKIPADPHALFKIASISKLYIAAATAKLISKQRLSQDDILTDHLPELAGRIENANKITLRMLLQHRSGIPDWIEDPEFPWTRSLADVSEVLELVLDDPAEFEPDTRYDYSNTNFLLIGNVLDEVLGYSHHRYIETELLAPLGLTRTFSLMSDVHADDMMSGYYIGQGGDVKALDFVSPGGSMVATAEDVGIFLRALIDGSLLNPGEQAVYSSTYAHEHTGLLPGYSSIARYHKDIDTVVIQFVNTSGGNSWIVSEIIYNRILRILRR